MNRFNPNGSAIRETLSGLGQNFGNAILMNKQQAAQGQQQELLKGLIVRANEGDETAINEIAQYDPRVAAFVSQQINQGKMELAKQIGPIALRAQDMADPIQVRAFLQSQAQDASPRLQKELIETLNMDDEQMMNDIRVGAQAYTGFIQPKDARTSGMKEYELAKQQGFDGSFVDYQTQMKKAGSTKINNNFNPAPGKQEPTKSIKTQEQKAIISAEKALSDLDKIGDTHSDEFLTTWGRTKAAIGSVFDKMDIDAGGLADFNAKRTKFANAAKQLFNNYRREITGAAASIQEMESLLESMLNEGQGPKAFRASFDLFMEKAQANLALAQKNSTEGVNVDPNNINSPSLGEPKGSTIKWSDM